MRNYSVLVVEDEKMLRKLLEYRLGKRYEVRGASNGEEALELIDHKIPDLIIADIMMPKMDGFALHKALQEDVETRVIPFIFLTARHDEITEREAKRRGVDDYITKPCDADAILIRISRILERVDFYKGEISSEDISSPSKPLNVFLCHAKEDKQSIIQLYEKLKEHGVNPWMDEKDILPGQDWKLEIRQAIRNCHTVLVCLTEHSVSKRGYVQKEIKFALDTSEREPEGAIFVVPVRFEECSVPSRLQYAQWLDLFEENGFDTLLEALERRANALEDVMPPSTS
jgi:CheY-like chemotaxis protein